MSAPTDRPIRIGNCSGFYGDRLSAMREMLEGAGDGHGLDVLTGDYLAELTMLILGRDQLKDPSLGFARTFLTQVRDCLALALEKGVRLVANAGGLNPSGLAQRIAEFAAAEGLSATVAWVDGDNLAPRAQELGLGDALTANAYLGGFGIAEALAHDADIVVTGRVTDASLVVGPAAWWFGWSPTSYDALAGAVVAGHVIECGTQATGGNFSGFLTMERDATPLGFPIAEVGSDGSSIITKHPGTGGLVTVDTVTAQLLYEVQSTHYLGPDVTTDLSSIRLVQEGADRVAVSGVTGAAPPERLKVCVNELGGHRNQLELVLTGLDIDEKAAWVRTQLEARLADDPPQTVTWSLGRLPEPDAATEEAASCLLRVTVKDPSPDRVGKAFSGAAVELALASYPGFTMTTPPGRGSPYGVYRPAYVDRDVVTERVHVVGVGEVATVPPPPEVAASIPPAPLPATSTELVHDAPKVSVPLGRFVHARSGDKGGDANIGLWVGADSGDQRPARITWLLRIVTPDQVRLWLPEAADLDVEVHPLPNIGGVNVLVRGLLGDGVAASTRFDPQAKAVGEWLRSRHVHVPQELL